MVQEYDLDLVPEIITSGARFSDHASFWDYGYAAILGTEDSGDFNPYYHTADDLATHLNTPYATGFVKTSLATFAHMGHCRVHPSYYYLPLVLNGG